MSVQTRIITTQAALFEATRAQLNAKQRGTFKCLQTQNEGLIYDIR